MKTTRKTINKLDRLGEFTRARPSSGGTGGESGPGSVAVGGPTFNRDESAADGVYASGKSVESCVELL